MNKAAILSVFTGCLRRSIGQWAAIGVFLAGHSSLAGISAGNCRQSLQIERGESSFNQVLTIMEQNPYSNENLPIIPLQMFKTIAGKLSFFVGKRSKDILNDRRDFRLQGVNKPIHPMGVGLVGKLKMLPTRWSGVFAGGEFDVLARASISQGNPFKTQADGQPQKRSTAMAIKVFSSSDHDQSVRTANAVFQNNLNGLLAAPGRALDFLSSEQTNQPGLNLAEIRHGYEVLTLLGVAFGSFSTPKDRMAKAPFINPKIRPVHSFAELGVVNPKDVRTPVWIQIRPLRGKTPVERDDFRLEIYDTLARDGVIAYDVFVSDIRDDRGQIQWTQAGRLEFTQAILSEGVDKNLLFPHDRLNSDFTGQKFTIPDGKSQYRSVPDDIQ
jgi:hypothetical protein